MALHRPEVTGLQCSVEQFLRILPARWGVRKQDTIHDRSDNPIEKLIDICRQVFLLCLASENHLELLERAWVEMFQKIDALIVPTVPTVAARRGQKALIWQDGSEEQVVEAFVRLNAAANLTGVPALSVPAGRHSSGLPFGVQFIGPAHSEAVLLKPGQLVEGITGQLPMPVPAPTALHT